MKERHFSQLIWREGMTFDATTTTGHHITLDAAKDSGGDDRGPKPIELLLTALGGCTAMDVLSILQKMREPIKSLEVFVQGTRASTHPMIYTDIEVVYRVRGQVNPAAVARAIDLSRDKYCGVGAMLEKSARISSRSEIEVELDQLPAEAHEFQPV